MFTGLVVYRKEDAVLGSRRTVPFWRAKRPLLSLERALAPLRQLRGGLAVPAPVLVQARARGRLSAGAKKLGRFHEK
jgi:hypothetical protein